MRSKDILKDCFQIDKTSIFGTIIGKNVSMKSLSLILFSVLFYYIQTPANLAAVHSSLEKAIKEGNEKRIISHSGEKILLEINNVESVYSKVQAEQILKDFFDKNKPLSFQVSFKSSTSGNYAMIGTLVTEKSKKFRVSMRLRDISNTFLLDKLTINPL